MKHDRRTQAAIDAGHPEWAELPVSAKEAIGAHFFTGRPCKNGHVSVRYRSGELCVECKRAYERNPAYHNQRRDWEKTPTRRDYNRAFEAHRRALKLKATPRWLTDADKEAMRLIYEEAARLTVETGIVHHVDHIVPLKATCPVTGKRIASGLHCPWNLQVIPASENQSKGAKFDGGW